MQKGAGFPSEISALPRVAWSITKELEKVGAYWQNQREKNVESKDVSHVNVLFTVGFITTIIAFLHQTAMWQTVQRPQCAVTSCKSCRDQMNLWKSRGKRQRPHKCWGYVCKTFKDWVDIDIHKCFMQPVGVEESSNDVGLPVKHLCLSHAPRRASDPMLIGMFRPTVIVRRKIGRKWTEPSYRPISSTRITSTQRKSKNMSPSCLVHIRRFPSPSRSIRFRRIRGERTGNA